MQENQHDHEFGCGCDCGCDRRDFLAASATSAGAMAMTWLTSVSQASEPAPPKKKEKAVVRVAFLYPPSKSFADDPDGWWSWPGNDFDAENRHKQYEAALAEMEQRLGMKITADQRHITNRADAERFAKELQTQRPDGVLLVMFYNRIVEQADLLLDVAAKAGIPAVFYIGLGVRHGPVAQYRRPGVYLIQSLDNFEAIESGMRMIQTKKAMGQAKLLSINEAKEPREGKEAFFGTTVRVIPFRRYAELFGKVQIDGDAKQLLSRLTRDSRKFQGITREALENAARAHLALKRLLAEEDADGLAMNCLRRGMLKPCVSFATLNSELIPAACENDLSAMYTQLLGQRLTGRPGFQHNPAFETERNHYYASHCTCPAKLYGPDGDESPYLLHRFAHTNEGSCAIQVFWKPDDPVTMVHYQPGKDRSLDVYAGRVVKSHETPPAAGCTTNVEIEITDRPDACMVQGHHNILICGDFARRFRLFAQLHKIRLADTGFQGPWPM